MTASTRGVWYKPVIRKLSGVHRSCVKQQSDPVPWPCRTATAPHRSPHNWELREVSRPSPEPSEGDGAREPRALCYCPGERSSEEVTTAVPARRLPGGRSGAVPSRSPQRPWGRGTRGTAGPEARLRVQRPPRGSCAALAAAPLSPSLSPPLSAEPRPSAGAEQAGQGWPRGWGCGPWSLPAPRRCAGSIRFSTRGERLAEPVELCAATDVPCCRAEP